MTILFLVVLGSLLLSGQVPATSAAAKISDDPSVPATYALGPDDQISVWAGNADEISARPYTVDRAGEISFPRVGRVHVAGLTVLQLEDKLKSLLRVYIKEPQVAVTLTESRSQPVTFAGAVVSPGTYQLRGRTSLLEMLTGSAGGLKPDAGANARIMRRLSEGRIPVPGASDDPTMQFSVAEVSLKDVLSSQSAGNIALRPYDVITIGQVPLVYVIGEVTRQGSIPASGSLTVLQALALSGGWTHTASPKKAKILRTKDGPTRTELAVNLTDILAGKAEDLRMMPNDILLVPDSAGRKITARTLEGMISAGTSILTYGIIR